MRIARWVADLPPGARVGAAYLDLWWNGRLDTPNHDVMALLFSFHYQHSGSWFFFKIRWVVEPFPDVAISTSDREREVNGVVSS